MTSAELAFADLASHLRDHREEMEQTILMQVYAIADAGEIADAEYGPGLQTTISSAVDFGTEAIERGGRGVPPPPPEMLVQARLAARNGVSLDTVLRRYFAGFSLFSGFVLRAAEELAFRGLALHGLLRELGARFDSLIVEVSEEHEREQKQRFPSAESLKTEKIKSLLAGLPLDLSDLGYDFDAWHVGVVGRGPGAANALSALPKPLDCADALVCQFEGDVAWAWFGSRSALDPDSLGNAITSRSGTSLVLAIGEPYRGLRGWRLTHRQAKAALRVAARRPSEPVRYGDVALVAGVLRDDLLATSLRSIYLDPLAAQRDGGRTLRETLEAYYSTNGNISSAAAALKVSRRTVANRLHAVEELLSKDLNRCAAELEVALRMAQMDSAEPPVEEFSPAHNV